MCHKYLLVINICREFSNNFLHLVVSASHQALSINLLYVVTHLVTKKFKTETIRKFWWNKSFSNLNVWDAVDDAALLDPLDESVARPVVRDRQTQRVFRLCDLDLLRPTLYCS